MKQARWFVLPLLFGVPAVTALALPDLLSIYEGDSFAKIKGGNCSVCHETSLGGPRNAFGIAFGDNLHTITPLLRAQFPDYFSYPKLKVNENLTIHFPDPEKKAVVVESGKKMVEVEAAEVTVDGRKAVAPKE